ncbi:HK97-gp10 family putative phage morphogenesis protein [Globicatella sp. PHS-GS-PNBC-21-1553]|uniref:HK97-gp10 family putative phage morphogenesis protein n=1 Tax=Globicatella sp. PHS-GS-PNBC-21-1553 TaxID=2885764 RepID=UPI00298EE883|nr:HK97-gp10 family putative phage morphogenesis protein [Globicatella sp. PHS-GS-PNBC-21-1553]WPC08009.1 HK97 gp10 family phage protein [Globicatella sp. PHS-GS-PNBC-21-1553]
MSKFINNQKYFKGKLKDAAIQFLMEGAELVEASQKALSPVDLGALRDSVGNNIDERSLTAQIGSNSEYAIFVNKGTGEFAENGMGRKGGWSYQDQQGQWHFTKGQKPQPFIEQSFKQNKTNIQSLAKNIFKNIK